MDGRHPRRNLALTIAALLFAVPQPGLVRLQLRHGPRVLHPPRAPTTRTLSSTSSTPSSSAQDDGSGTFIASLSNGDPAATISFTSLDFGSNSTIAVADFDPIAVAPRQLVNLADGQGIKVQGDFTKGDFLALTVDFDNGESSRVNVPVVDAVGQWEGLDNGTGTPIEPSESASPS